jgi:thiamine kinase-like enzyme
MTEFHGTNELDFLNNANCLKSVSAIGKMHHASVSVQPDVPLISQYENGIEKLNKIKRKVSAKKYPSDMDLLFRKTINTAEECAKTAVDILNKNDFNDTKAIYIHNSLKEDNIIINNGKVYIIDWDNACVGSPMADLAFFIRRYIRKNAYYSHLSDENYISLSEFLTAYKKQNNLGDKEDEILHALLIYPSRYINVMEDIYKKQRCFIPTSLSAKAEEITKQWEFTANYISHTK